MTTAPTSSSLVAHAQDLWKSYDGFQAVRGVSIDVARGEVVGLVGPNGSGKTTTIRMLLGIMPADEGSIALFGSASPRDAWSRTGYLPEERGLYRGLRVLPTLIYLAELKGMRRQDAHREAERILDRLDLTPHARKKISELSRGLGQLAQFGATIIHRPQLVILDEPFSGLDPVNQRLMKSIVADLREEGVGVMFSTHQMSDVEELCDRVIMINRGKVVLDGPLGEVRRSHAGNGLVIVSSISPEGFPGVESARLEGSSYEVRLAPGSRPEQLLTSLIERGATIERFEIALPSLEEIFLRLVDEDD